MAETNFDRRKSKTSLFSLVFLTKKSDIKKSDISILFSFSMKRKSLNVTARKNKTLSVERKT